MYSKGCPHAFFKQMVSLDLGLVFFKIFSSQSNWKLIPFWAACCIIMTFLLLWKRPNETEFKLGCIKKKNRKVYALRFIYAAAKIKVHSPWILKLFFRFLLILHIKIIDVISQTSSIQIKIFFWWFLSKKLDLIWQLNRALFTKQFG